MRWPWVSRSTLEVREQQVVELKAQIAALQEKYDYLDNQFVWRATGVAKDPAKLPEQYRHKFIKTEEPANPLSDPKVKAEPKPNRVRVQMKNVEDERERKFQEMLGKVTEISQPRATEAV